MYFIFERRIYELDVEKGRRSLWRQGHPHYPKINFRLNRGIRSVERDQEVPSHCKESVTILTCIPSFEAFLAGVT